MTDMSKCHGSIYVNFLEKEGCFPLKFGFSKKYKL
jgi:hypothetical protein